MDCEDRVMLLSEAEVESAFNRLIEETMISVEEAKCRFEEKRTHANGDKCDCLPCRMNRGEITKEDLPKAHRHQFLRAVLRILTAKELREGVAAFVVSAVSEAKVIPDISDEGVAMRKECSAGGNLDNVMRAAAIAVDDVLDRVQSQLSCHDRASALAIFLGKLAEVHIAHTMAKTATGVRSFLDAMVGNLMKDRKNDD